MLSEMFLEVLVCACVESCIFSCAVKLVCELALNNRNRLPVGW